jgi:ribonuclease E
MMEELERAMEADRAKPQVGQLSDLGLVEMTRHRQGQAISEIFAKKCPHCQGNGYIMEDIKFASATAEGEYRAKAAKIKLPMNNKKNKFNKFNNNQPQSELKEETQIQEEKLEIQVNPSTEAQNEIKEVQEEKESKRRNSKKPRFDKRKVKQEILDNTTASTVIPNEAVLEPVLPTQIEPEVSAETAVEDAASDKKSKKPTRSRRPNRNSQKKTKTTQKKTKSDEE